MLKTDLSEPSKVFDSRDVPLAELSAMSIANIDETLGRFLPSPEQAAPVAFAKFQSTI